MATYPMVIRNARIVDGTGRPAFFGDVAVRDDRIAAVGEIAATGEIEIDADRRVLAPGFIDVHTHYDPQLCRDKLATPLPEHGVTSLIVGNCSVSLAPVRPEAKDRLVGWFGSVEDMDGDLLRRSVSFDWESVRDYLARIRLGLGPNVGVFIGHAVIRYYVMREAAQQRAASDDEIAAMVELLRDALQAGAFGLSFTFNHLDDKGNELPCIYAERRELKALIAEVAAAERMVQCAPDLRPGGNALRYYDLFGGLALETGARVTLSPLIVSDLPGPDWQLLLRRLEEWRAKGASIFAQVQTRPFDHMIDLGRGSPLFSKTPLWRQIMDRPLPERIAMLSDPARRDVLRTETAELEMAIKEFVVQSSAAPRNRDYLGRKVGEIAATEGRPMSDVLLDIALADDLTTQFGLTGIMHADVDRITRLLEHPATHVGAADAGAHIAAFAGAGDTCYLLEKFVRAERKMTLERAVQHLTGDIARDWRIRDRGEIAVGRSPISSSSMPRRSLAGRRYGSRICRAGAAAIRGTRRVLKRSSSTGASSWIAAATPTRGPALCCSRERSPGSRAYRRGRHHHRSGRRTVPASIRDAGDASQPCRRRRSIGFDAAEEI